MRFLRFSDPGFEDAFGRISARGETTPAEVLTTVQMILDDVRARGDAALYEYTERFDRLNLAETGLEVSATEISQAVSAVDSTTLATLQLAADRITAFHRKQREETWLPGLIGSFGSGVRRP
ncbi:MAG: histidinol dehydrogenase [Desulfuromonadales bacterium]